MFNKMSRAHFTNCRYDCMWNEDKPGAGGTTAR